MRVGDTGDRLIIMWISKGWTTHELQLPVFYREALARLLALEKFRNVIETNIEADCTLYINHNPFFLKTVCPTRQGGEMLFADPLSRVCGPTEEWHDPSIPSKVATLLKHLPDSVRETPRVKLYAGKDTSGISKIIYQEA